MPRLLSIFFLLLAVLGGAAQAETVILDRVAAVVEDDVIMESELETRLQTVHANLKARGADMPPPEQLRQEILNLMIQESIQLQMGQRAGVRITDKQLNQAIADIAANNDMTLAEFRTQLQQQNVSWEGLRDQIRTQMIVQQVQRGQLAQKIQVTEQEVDNFLQTPEGQALVSPTYRLEHLLLPVSSNVTDPAPYRRAARALVQAARNGTPLAALAERDDLPASPRYSDLGWRKAGELPDLFAPVLADLAVGEVADPLESASGFHVIRLADKRGESEKAVQQTRVRHILLKPSEIRTDAQARALANDLRERILSGESFGDLARQHSDDIGSAREGGDLGWTNPGQMVPVFEQTMNAAEIGEIPPPFRSQFGWHLLQVQERRQQDMSDVVRRNRARQYLFEKKFEEELEAWLVKIRDEAYVDIK